MYKMEECWAVAEDYSNIKKADNLKEIEALEQRVKEQETEHKMRILAFKRLCKIYFDIASSVIGEESVRDLVNAEITEINDSTEKRGG